MRERKWKGELEGLEKMEGILEEGRRWIEGSEGRGSVEGDKEEKGGVDEEVKREGRVEGQRLREGGVGEEGREEYYMRDKDRMGEELKRSKWRVKSYGRGNDRWRRIGLGIS